MRKHLNEMLACSFLLGGMLLNPAAQAQDFAVKKVKTGAVPLTEALNQITTRFHTQFFYDIGQLRGKSIVLNWATLGKKPLEEVLKSVLYPNDFVFLYVKENYYTIVPRDQVGNNKSQSVTPSPVAALEVSGAPSSRLAAFPVSGKVMGANGEVLSGVTIEVVGSSLKTTSGADGSFEINVPSEKSVLRFSYVGYATQSVPVQGKNQIMVSLSLQANSMDNIVVIGYGTMRKSDVTGTISSIKGRELEKTPVGSAAEALTGRVAGVQVTTQDGSPGSDIEIKVRGGMSITQDNAPLYIIDGFASDVGLKGLSASDIESIEVLKDAATTSIYGARGANGVILITTRSGRKGKNVISYDAYVGFRELPRKVSVLNTLDYVKLQYEMALRTGGNSYTNFVNNYGNYADFDSRYQSNGLDWQDIMFGRRALNHNHNVTLSGGGENNAYMLSYTHNYEDGILVNTNNVRNNLRFKFDQKLTKKLDANLNLMFYDNRKNGDITAGSTLQNSLLYRPVAGVAYTDEQLQDAMDDPIGNSLRNPKVTQMAQTRYSVDRNIAANMTLNYKINKDFTFKALGSATLRNGRYDSFDDQNSSASASRGGPFGSQQYSESVKWQNTNTLTYIKKFRDHSINAMIGNEMVFSEGRSLKEENRQFPTDNFGIYDLSLGGLPQKPVSGYDQDGLVSYFGRLFYGYKDRYLVTATLRTDGSSKFAKENRFGYFPSVSAAWKISQEKFLSNNPVISDLKLRASYGQAGNNRIGNNRYESIFESDWYTNGSLAVPTLIPSALANPNLKWETTTSSNIGLDFGAFHNRLTATAEFYNNTTKDLLLTASIPSTTGYGTQTRNIGATRNRGMELTLNTVNIQTPKFRWTTDFNISFNKNKVLSLVSGSDEDVMVFKSGVGSYIEDYKVAVGEQVGLMYGYVYDGFYGVDDFDATLNASTGQYTYALKAGVPSLSSLTRATFQPGSTRYKDVNGDGFITPDDRTIIGNAAPKHYGGINNTFSYKNFDLGIFFNWVYGNDVLNYTKGRLLATYQTNQNQSAELLNRFTYVDGAGNLVTEPKALAALNQNATKHAAITQGPESNMTLTTSEFVEDGSFLRLNNLTLGYSLKDALIKKLGITKFHVYVTAYNLYTFTKYTGFDPEVNRQPNGGLTPGIDWAAYPRTRSFVFGVNVNL